MFRHSCIAEKLERPFRGHARVELSKASRRRVSGIREYRLAGTHALFIHLLEAIEGQIDFAPHLDSSLGSVAGEAQRNVAQCPQILGDNLADQSIAARCTLDENTVLVSETDGSPVDLQLNGVAAFGYIIAHESNEPLLPCCKLIVVESIAERKHRLDVRVLCELALHGSANSHRRRVGRSELRVVLLDFLELAEELIVLAIRERRPVEYVVLVRCAVKRFPESCRPRRCFCVMRA